ncbi:MAG: DNA translocase FtsK [Minisyncoccia bacterium]
MSDEIKRIEEKVDDLFQKLSEKQNAQFTELMTEIRKVGGLIEQQEEYNSDDVSDDIYEEAKAVVIKERKASTSYLQRKLGVGYARAANLIDMLEENKVIGPGSGAKPREVLVNE